MELPRTVDIMNKLKGSNIFSVMDLKSAYHNIQLDEESKLKTSLSTRRGTYMFNVLPFGVRNAQSIFSKVLQMALSEHTFKYCAAFIDDILVYNKNVDDHIECLDKIMNSLQKHGFKLNHKKCKIVQKQVKFLGHIISPNYFRSDPDKLEIIKTWPSPINQKQLSTFLGFSSFYRKFIPRSSEISSVLFDLTKSGIKFYWSDIHEKAFQKLKLLLLNNTTLYYPDFNLPFIISTDASNTGIGCTLSQKMNDGHDRVVSFAAKKLSKEERNYSVTRRELLAIVYFVDYFKIYLTNHFLIRTDHKCLIHLDSMKNFDGQLARWMLKLSQYNYTIKYRKNADHVDCDMLSRFPYSDNISEIPTENKNEFVMEKFCRKSKGTDTSDLNNYINSKKIKNPFPRKVKFNHEVNEINVIQSEITEKEKFFQASEIFKRGGILELQKSDTILM